METKKAVRTASWMMLLWMAVYLFSTLFVPRWIDFLSMIGCILPLYALRGRYWPYGTRNCNLMRYGRRQYVLFFGVLLCGCALLSFLGALTSRIAGMSAAAPSGRTDFWYSLVFACMIPALFEELLLRCGVLGALSPLGGAGVLLCGLMFGLMHQPLTRLPYTVFAGILLSALVFLTECVYIGILFHFLNNFCALLLSYVQDFALSCAFAAAFAVLLAVCLFALRGKPISRDMHALFSDLSVQKIAVSLPLVFWLFVSASAVFSAVVLFL